MISHQGGIARTNRCVLLCLLAMLSIPAHAVTSLNASLGKLSGPGVIAVGVVATMSAPFQRSAAQLSVASLQLDGLPIFRDISMSCSALQLNSQLLICDNANGTFKLPSGEPLSIRGTFDLDFITGAVAVDLKSFKQADNGDAAITFKRQRQQWSLTAAATEFKAETVLPLLQQLTDIDVTQANISAGKLWLEADLRGGPTSIDRADISLRWNGLAAANADSTIAAENLAGDIEASVRRRGNNLAINSTVTLSDGYGGVDPVYVDFRSQPLALVVSATGQHARWNIQQLSLRQGTADKALIAAEGQLLLDFDEEDPLQNADLRWRSESLKTLFPIYAQPLLLETSFADASLTGAVEGEVVINSGALTEADIRFQQVSLNNGNGLYALKGLNGELLWSANNPVPKHSSFGWQGGSLYNLPVGAAQLHVVNQNGGLRLTKPTRIPLVDGALTVNKLSVLPGDSSELLLDAVIEPISLKPLTQAFGWPAFSGTVAGRIPDIEYRRGELTVGGVLEASLFDGTLQAGELRVQDMFGRLPKLQANLTLRDLNLERVTDVFGVGRITGGLNADVNNLLLVGWRPAAFDARLYSPKKKMLPRKLSQRALDNIADVGGAGAALSTPLIALFDDFRYDRIEWRCQLVGDVCKMGGIKTTNGYYLVKGAGLPRVDVIGHTRRVDWPLLINQIKEAIDRGEVSTGK